MNPDHLFLGNTLINMRDKEVKGRGGHPSGERAGAAKLSNEDVANIRWLAIPTDLEVFMERLRQAGINQPRR